MGGGILKKQNKTKVYLQLFKKPFPRAKGTSRASPRPPAWSRGPLDSAELGARP